MSVTISPQIHLQFFTASGVVASGYQLFTYQAGTSIKQATWTDSTQSTQNANPLKLDSQGRAYVWPDPTLVYKYVLALPTDTDPPQSPVETVDNIQSPINLSNITQALIGATLYPRTAAEIAAGVTPTNYAYAPGHVLRYGNVGTGADDTTALTNWLKVGGELTAPVTLTALVSSVLNLSSNTTIRASTGFVIKQKNGAGIAGAIVYGNAVQNVIIECLTIDGNAADATNATALTYGITFTGGTNNHTRKCYIHDTTQAGMQFAMETDSSEEGSWLQNCGRNLGTDNHGLMAISNTATSLTRFKVIGTSSTGAYRKGITTYSLSPGSIDSVTILGCVVSGCGLGGIYTGNGSGATALQKNVNICGNVCFSNYANIQVGNCASPTVTGNQCSNDTGGGNLIFIDLNGGTITGNALADSSVAGIRLGTSYLSNNLNITCTGNNILRSNQTSTGYGPGIDVTNTQYSNFVGNTIDDQSGAAKQTYCISESGTSDYNVITDNRISNATSSVLHIVGSHTVYDLNPISSSVQQISVGSTITNSPSLPGAGGVAVSRISMTTAGANVTGIIMEPGTFPGMTCTVVNEDGAHTATMAAAGTSNVADGTSCVISAATQKTFVWDTATSLWYHS